MRNSTKKKKKESLLPKKKLLWSNLPCGGITLDYIPWFSFPGRTCALHSEWMSLLYLVCQTHFPVHPVTPTVQTIAPSLCFLVIEFLTCCKNDCASSIAFSVVVPVVELVVVCFPSKTSRIINNSRKNQAGAAAQTTECTSLVRDSW